jgi:hypothetical protein
MAAFHGGGGGGGGFSRPGGRAEALAWALADAEAAIAAAPAGARWLLKPSLANKGAGFALVRSAEAAAAHVAALRNVGEWVLQRYVERPLLLWRGGRKFHLRVYALADGDLRVRVFREALCLAAALPYGDGGGDDARRHITNTCVAAEAGGGDFCEEEAVHRLAELPAELAARASARSGGGGGGGDAAAAPGAAAAAAGLAQTAALYARICAVVM